MSGKLAAEIKQTKPFDLLEEEALLNLGRAYEYLQQRVGDLLKDFQLTPTQYNMLRILRGAGRDGVTCSQACERMISPDPDITRLLDRMEARKLISRERSTQDRRVVITCITPEGLELANQIDKPLTAVLKKYLGRAGKDRLTNLIDTLELLREEPE